MEIYNQEYYGNEPDLIAPSIKSSMAKIQSSIAENKPSVISDTITKHISDFYKKYIQKNKITIIIIILIIIFLIYRYYKKKKQKLEKKQEEPLEYNFDDYFPINLDTPENPKTEEIIPENYQNLDEEYLGIDDLVQNSNNNPEENIKDYPDI